MYISEYSIKEGWSMYWTVSYKSQEIHQNNGREQSEQQASAFLQWGMHTSPETQIPLTMKDHRGWAC